MINFNYDIIEEYCVKLEAIIKNVEDIIDRYTSAVKQIQSASIWEGDAATAFMERANNTIKILNLIDESLLNSVSYIRDCGVKFGELEKNILSALDKIL